MVICSDRDPSIEGIVRVRARYQRGKADFFALYNPVLDVVYLVAVEEVPTTGMHIRWGETKNNQTTRVNWHADYVIDAKLEGL